MYSNGPEEYVSVLKLEGGEHHEGPSELAILYHSREAFEQFKPFLNEIQMLLFVIF